MVTWEQTYAEFIAHLFGFTGMHSNISWTKHNMEGSAVEVFWKASELSWQAPDASKFKQALESKARIEMRFDSAPFTFNDAVYTGVPEGAVAMSKWFRKFHRAWHPTSQSLFYFDDWRKDV